MASFLKKVWSFYYEGFASMTVGRTLWLIIAVKLIIMFAILKLFFFPNMLSSMDDYQKAEFVTNELINR